MQLMQFMQLLLIYSRIPACLPDPWHRGRIVFLAHRVCTVYIVTTFLHTDYVPTPIRYGIVILFLDETRKWWNRTHPKSTLAKIAW